MSVLNPKQAAFVAALSKRTGLDPKVVAAWTLAEESGTAASQRAAQGNNNWLNIGYYDSGAGKLAHDRTFADPATAADATAQFLQGKKWGAAQGIRDILKTAGKDPAAQMAAITNSPWASSHYKNSNGLRGTYKLVGGEKLPAAASAATLPLPDGTASTVATPAGPSLLPITDVGASANRGGQALSGAPTAGGFMEAALQTLGVKRHSSLGAQEALTSNQAATKANSLLPLPDGTASTVTNPTMMDKTAGPTKSNSTIVDAATKFLGTPYLWGGTTAKGLDCSGLVQLAVKNATGKTIPRVAQDQYDASTKIPTSQLNPGDIIGFGTKTNVHHIGIYMGNGKFIDAPHTGAKVRVESLKGRNDIVGAGRF